MFFNWLNPTPRKRAKPETEIADALMGCLAAGVHPDELEALTESLVNTLYDGQPLTISGKQSIHELNPQHPTP